MGIRNGKEYLSSLQDGRQIIYNGRVIEDVTKEPGFRNTSQAIAQFYDFQSAPELETLMTYQTEEGERIGMAFIEPRSKEDLRRRAAAYTAWAEVTCGLIARSPDYMNSFIMGIAAARTRLGESDPVLGERAYQIYLDARHRDLCMTHTVIHPFFDRTKELAEQPQLIRIIRETDEGVVISGARSVATLAPFSNIDLSMQVNPPKLKPGDEQFALSFTIPINSPGLRWICRDLYDHEYSHFDAPLSSKIDEMDCVGIFEECLIPWQNIFVYKNIDIYNRQPQIVQLDPITAHHVLIKNIAKTRFMFGLAHLIAESSRLTGFVNVQERLGEFAIYLHNLEALAIAAVEGAVQDPVNKLWYPNPHSVIASLRLYPEYYQRMINHLIQLGGSSYISTPQEQTLEVYGEAIENYFGSATSNTYDRVALSRMAWDLVGSGWGGRQGLYERFFSGDTQLRKALCYFLIDKSEAIMMVKRLLTPAATPGQPFPIPSKYTKKDNSKPESNDR